MEILDKKQAQGFYIVNDANKRYLTNFSGSTSLVVIFKNEIVLITDGRYSTQVKTEVYDKVRVIIKDIEKSYFETLIDVLNENNVQKLLIEGEYLSYVDSKQLAGFFDLESVEGYIEGKRITKNNTELEKIKKATEITTKSFNYIKEKLTPGITELEVKALLEASQLTFGAEGASFESIVAFGDNTAKPHANPSSRKLKENDVVTLDFGCFYHGYVSDMTRSFFVGKNIDKQLSEIYDVVFEAHIRQVAAARAGITAKELDAIGREYITEHGYGNEFNHNTGHGIGLEIHEEPTIGKNSETILKTGMIITIEPGIYIEGLGGIRIENDIIITDNGCEVLNSAKIEKFI